jgi:hypothetical protein
VMCSPQTQDPLLVDGPLCNKPPVGPHAAIAPARMVGLQRFEAREPALIPLADPQRPAARQPNRASLLFHAHVSSPTSGFNRAFACSRWASWRVR